MGFNPGASGVGGASDVALNNKQNNEVLTYDSAVDKWRNQAVVPTLGGDLSGTTANAQIAAGVVTSTELAANAVTTAKITDANVTTLKIADVNVTTAKLADSSVTDAKVATGIAQSKITNLTSDLAGKASTSHTHAAADIASGTIASARLGSGTANSTTYLRGDGTWATPAGGGGSVTYADVPAGSTFTVYKAPAGSWPGSRPSARTDIYFIFKGPGTPGTGTSPESIMLDGDDWQILP